MVGGGSFIPSVQRLMRREFGDRVLLERPLDAVARGAAAFAAGVDFYDHIQHDYAIRCVSRRQGRLRVPSARRSRYALPHERDPWRRSP